MNPSAILALLSNLYEQVAQLTAENQQLREALAGESDSGDEHS